MANHKIVHTFYPFPSIHHLKDTYRSVKETAQFIGCDAVDGKPLYDSTIPLPSEVHFVGTVKVHGTNAGIVYNPRTGELWAQSRNHVISDKSDNCGFHTFVMLNKEVFINIMKQLSSDLPVAAFGEWFGAGIQKNVAVEKLQRRLMIFAVKIINDNDSKNPLWLPREAVELFYSPEHFIWNSYNFSTYDIVIDFNDTTAVQNRLIEITDVVEKECPVGKYFGVSGIGEGVVWSSEDYGRFKVKGIEHSSSKVTVLASVNTEKLSSIAAFVDYAVTDNRLNQGIEQVFTVKGLKPTAKQTRDFIAWINLDVLKEESYTLTENNLIPEDVIKAIADKARKWYTHTLFEKNCAKT